MNINELSNKLFNITKEYYIFWENNIENIKKIVNNYATIDNKKDLNLIKNEFNDIKFLSNKIKEQIINIINNKKIKLIKISIFNHNINLYTHLDNYNTFILIYFLLFIPFLNKNSKIKRVKLQKIYIFPIKYNKFIPKKFEYINEEHINSACTFVYKNMLGGEIFIWRMDELMKVLIHEMIHSFLYDYHLFDSNNIKYINKSIFKNINSLNLNEVFTEIKTTFYFISLKLFLFNKESRLCRNKFINNLNLILNEELKYSIKNCKIILNYYNLSNINKLLTFTQNASIFSYIVLKSSLLFNIIKSDRYLFNKIDSKNSRKFIKKLENCFTSKEWSNLIYNEKNSKNYINRLKFLFFS